MMDYGRNCDLRFSFSASFSCYFVLSVSPLQCSSCSLLRGVLIFLSCSVRFHFIVLVSLGLERCSIGMFSAAILSLYGCLAESDFSQPALGNISDAVHDELHVDMSIYGVIFCNWVLPLAACLMKSLLQLECEDM